MIDHAVATSEPKPRAPDATFLVKVFYAFAILAALSVVISIGGKMLGQQIVMAGHTNDTTIREVVIGNNVVAVPANAIRFEGSRRDGVAQRLDLYLRWPDMTGYSTEHSDDFNHAGGSRNIVFLTFEERMMSRDMSGRFEPIYRSLIEEPGERRAGGITVYRFKAKSGYVEETLAVAERPGQEPFVARCFSGTTTTASLAPCERDVQLGDGLSLTYRFPLELLANWRAVDAAVLRQATAYLKSGR